MKYIKEVVRMDWTRRGIQSLRSSVIQLNASVSDFKGWSFAQSYSLFDWCKKTCRNLSADQMEK